MGTIMLFSLLYEIFFRAQWLQPMSDTNQFNLLDSSLIRLLLRDQCHVLARAGRIPTDTSNRPIRIVGQFIKNRSLAGLSCSFGDFIWLFGVSGSSNTTLSQFAPQ
jgi:hypothetical protein